MLEVIKHERRVELAFEGLRYFDLVRWRNLTNAMHGIWRMNCLGYTSVGLPGCISAAIYILSLAFATG
jgi:hypothetical protein